MFLSLYSTLFVSITYGYYHVSRPLLYRLYKSGQIASTGLRTPLPPPRCPTSPVCRQAGATSHIYSASARGCQRYMQFQKGGDVGKVAGTFHLIYQLPLRRVTAGRPE